VHPTQAIELFGNVYTPCGTLAIRDLCIKILNFVVAKQFQFSFVILSECCKAKLIFPVT